MSIVLRLLGIALIVPSFFFDHIKLSFPAIPEFMNSVFFVSGVIIYALGAIFGKLHKNKGQ
jgi:hypothetical protein